MTLPEAVAQTEVKADYADGVLTVTMHKAPETVNCVVKVSLTAADEK